MKIDNVIENAHIHKKRSTIHIKHQYLFNYFFMNFGQFRPQHIKKCPLTENT